MVRDEIHGTYMVHVESMERPLVERFGRRRAEEIIAACPLVAVRTVDRGGPYVDIRMFGYAVAVVNTWDYGQGRRVYEHSEEGIQPLVQEWLNKDFIDHLGAYA